jgi:iron complex outermembrane receptor protein
MVVWPVSPAAAQDTKTPPADAFTLGEIVTVLGDAPGSPGVGASVVSREQIQIFERLSLDQAINLAPGVVGSIDSNGRRNEADIFVRGFGRWQVPLLIDGVRVYLPADNRLDFGRFLTSDIAEIQIRKGYASVIDGPGAMGGEINLVTRKPTKAVEAEGGLSVGGRTDDEMWTAYAMAGTKRPRYYAQGSATLLDRDFFSLSGDYRPLANSLQPAGVRLGSDTRDWRMNGKVGLTPNASDEYTINYTKQSGEKGAPLNVFNNPPVPGNGFWRWPWWNVQNTSFLSHTRLADASYVKTKVYYNTFSNGLDAYDDITYMTQSANGRFHSPYRDRAFGGSAEVGSTMAGRHSLKGAVHLRRDAHSEYNVNRPTHPTLATFEPEHEQAQYTWSLAAEDTFHLSRAVDVVGGISYEKYRITRAEEFTAARGIFENPKGGSDAFNWQSAVLWHYSAEAALHVSVSDRGRFPTIFELYSTRFGTSTPNPALGQERATNVEAGWKGTFGARATVEAAVFYSDVRDLIQTVILPDATTQTQNVGDGEFYGFEVAADTPVTAQLSVGGNYSLVRRTITDALQPLLQATGVPTHKAFLFASWRPLRPLTITPSLEVAGDRWSDVNTNPAPAVPYVRLGAYTLANVSAQYLVHRSLELTAGLKNLTDDNYQLAWGFPQPGRTFYVKTRVLF